MTGEEKNSRKYIHESSGYKGRELKNLRHTLNFPSWTAKMKSILQNWKVSLAGSIYDPPTPAISSYIKIRKLRRVRPQIIAICHVFAREEEEEEGRKNEWSENGSSDESTSFRRANGPKDVLAETHPLEYFYSLPLCVFLPPNFFTFFSEFSYFGGDVKAFGWLPLMPMLWSWRKQKSPVNQRGAGVGDLKFRKFSGGGNWYVYSEARLLSSADWWSDCEFFFFFFYDSSLFSLEPGNLWYEFMNNCCLDTQGFFKTLLFYREKKCFSTEIF